MANEPKTSEGDRKMAKRNSSHFGAGGSCTCGSCGKRTRATYDEHAAVLELCQSCYEDAGDENTHNDCHYGNPVDGCRFCDAEKEATR